MSTKPSSDPGQLAAGPFDPERPLPGAPDPWEASRMPPLRDGPPYLMTEMIAAEPALAERILARLAGVESGAGHLAAAIRATAAAGDQILVTGCGTSEHGALGTVEILRDAMRRARLPTTPSSPLAVQAFEAALDPQSSGLLIGVSHEGATAATNAALAAAHANGVQTALITATDRSPGAALADVAVTTEEMDQAWCHTVGYVSPLIAAAAVGGHLTGDGVHGAAVRSLMGAGLSDPGATESIAAGLAQAGTILVIASGADRPAARELVLKLEEGTWVPSAMRDLETFLHGHLPATDERTGLVLILSDRNRRAERIARTRQALAAASAIGLRTAAIVSAGVNAEIDAALTTGGRIVIPEAPGLPAPVASLLGTATALQLLTERLARARGTNPDPIRRDDDRYRAAAEAAG